MSNPYNIIKNACCAFYLKYLNETPVPQQKPTFIIDRFIDGGDDKKSIYVGIIKDGKQGIRIGEVGEPIHKLINFTRIGHYKLIYEFENDVNLSVSRFANNMILYNLRTSKYNQQGCCNSIYKNISMDSSELDEIGRLQ